MRYLAALLTLAACSSDPSSTADAGEDRPVPLDTPTVDRPPTTPDVPPAADSADIGADTGQLFDAPAADVRQDGSPSHDAACRPGWAVCDPAMPRCVDLSRGELRDGRYVSCGQCGSSCSSGFVCENGRCAR